LTIAADGLAIAMGRLGLDPAWLANGTKAYAGLTVTRSLGRSSQDWTLGTYYSIQYRPQVGDAVKASVAADLYSGSSVVGHVAAGDLFTVRDVQGDWIALTKPDGTSVNGWIQASKLEAATP
jgi:hypothetical protein